MINRKDKIKILAYAILALIGMTFLQHTPEFIDNLFSIKPNITKLDDVRYKIDISKLHPNDYVVSLGRPRAHCDIRIDGEIAFKGKSTVIDKRSNLLSSAAFNQAGTSRVIEIDCEQFQSGFVPRLGFTPQIYTYTAGMLIHFYRAAIEMFIGPLGALLLLISSIIFLFLRQSSDDETTAYRYILYASIGFIYSLSLAYYTRVFLTGIDASRMHVALRVAYSLSFNLLVITSLPNRYFLILTHTAALVGMFFLPTEQSLEGYYRAIHIIMPLATLWTFYDLLSASSRTRDVFFFQVITLSWSIAQFMDTVKLNSNVGFYAAPLYLMLISLFLIYRIFVIQKRNLLIQNLNSSISESIRSSKDISSCAQMIIRDIAKAISGTNLSIYVDDFVLGAAAVPKDSMSCIVTTNNQNDESKRKIDLHEHDSPTVQALSKNSVVFRKGIRDQKWFMVFPLANTATLNIAFIKDTQDFVAYEAHEVVNQLLPALNGFSILFERHGYKMNSSLSKLRSFISDGIHELFIGALFIDIADYSKHTEYYGDEYSSFVSSHFFPALIKHMSNYAVPEVVRGDEVYFVICDYTSSQAGDTSQKTAFALSRVQEFLVKISPDLCAKWGFPNVECRMGVTVGPGAIVVDDIQVRTSGDHINRAKRLQDAASKGETLTDEVSFTGGLNRSLISISKKSIVVKKNLIEAVKVGVKRAA